MAKYPFLNGNYEIRLYGYEINATGWSGVQTFINVSLA
jgi:hypothetical protein